MRAANYKIKNRFSFRFGGNYFYTKPFLALF